MSGRWGSFQTQDVEIPAFIPLDHARLPLIIGRNPPEYDLYGQKYEQVIKVLGPRQLAEGVSRTHVKLIRPTPGSAAVARLVDLGSRNGVAVNGVRIFQRALTNVYPGDGVLLGIPNAESVQYGQPVETRLPKHALIFTVRREPPPPPPPSPPRPLPPPCVGESLTAETGTVAPSIPPRPTTPERSPRTGDRDEGGKGSISPRTEACVCPVIPAQQDAGCSIRAGDATLPAQAIPVPLKASSSAPPQQCPPSPRAAASSPRPSLSSEQALPAEAGAALPSSSPLPLVPTKTSPPVEVERGGERQESADGAGGNGAPQTDDDGVESSARMPDVVVSDGGREHVVRPRDAGGTETGMNTEDADRTEEAEVRSGDQARSRCQEGGVPGLVHSQTGACDAGEHAGQRLKSGGGGVGQPAACGEGEGGAVDIFVHEDGEQSDDGDVLEVKVVRKRPRPDAPVIELLEDEDAGKVAEDRNAVSAAKRPRAANDDEGDGAEEDMVCALCQGLIATAAVCLGYAPSLSSSSSSASQHAPLSKCHIFCWTCLHKHFCTQSILDGSALGFQDRKRPCPLCRNQIKQVKRSPTIDMTVKENVEVKAKRAQLEPGFEEDWDERREDGAVLSTSFYEEQLRGDPCNLRAETKEVVLRVTWGEGGGCFCRSCERPIAKGDYVVSWTTKEKGETWSQPIGTHVSCLRPSVLKCLRGSRKIQELVDVTYVSASAINKGAARWGEPYDLTVALLEALPKDRAHYPWWVRDIRLEGSLFELKERPPAAQPDISFDDDDEVEYVHVITSDANLMTLRQQRDGALPAATFEGANGAAAAALQPQRRSAEYEDAASARHEHGSSTSMDAEGLFFQYGSQVEESYVL